MTGSAFLLAFLVLFVINFTFGVSIYGVVLSFKKVWYVGLAALVFPLFGLTVGIAKLIFKKDLLN